MDPGGIHPCEAREPSGLGDVCVCLLFHHDFPLARHLRLRRTQKQWRVGSSGKHRGRVCVSVWISVGGVKPCETGEPKKR